MEIAFHCMMIIIATIFALLVLVATGNEWYYKCKHNEELRFATGVGILVVTPLVVYSSIIIYSNIRMSEELLKNDTILYVPAIISYDSIISTVGDAYDRPVGLTLSSPYGICGVNNAWVSVDKEGIKVNLVGYREGKALIELNDKTVMIDARFIKIEDKSNPDDQCIVKKDNWAKRSNYGYR